MLINETDLPFDPVRVRLKIHEYRKRTEGLIALMESYGIPVDPPRPKPEQQEARGVQLRTAIEGPDRTSGNGNTPKLADLGVEVIAKKGGRAHGKEIVQELQRMGHLKNVAHPDSTMHTALSRDPRAERAKDARNTWILSGK